MVAQVVGEAGGGMGLTADPLRFNAGCVEGNEKLSWRWTAKPGGEEQLGALFIGVRVVLS